MSAMPTVSDRQRELRNVACIVGVDESDQIGTLPNTSQLSLHLEAIIPVPICFQGQAYSKL